MRCTVPVPSPSDLATLGYPHLSQAAFASSVRSHPAISKTNRAPRVIPIHSELYRAGLLDYTKALPQDGLLFPGLKRRESKGGKIGARHGELFRKKLIKLGIKRAGLCFHSFRHLVADRLEQAAVSQTDAARVLGHAIAGMSYGTYSSGPGLARLKAVEALRYDDVAALTR
jgi:integrase